MVFSRIHEGQGRLFQPPGGLLPRGHGEHGPVRHLRREDRQRHRGDGQGELRAQLAQGGCEPGVQGGPRLRLRGRGDLGAGRPLLRPLVGDKRLHPAGDSRHRHRQPCGHQPGIGDNGEYTLFTPQHMNSFNKSNMEMIMHVT